MELTWAVPLGSGGGSCPCVMQLPGLSSATVAPVKPFGGEVPRAATETHTGSLVLAMWMQAGSKGWDMALWVSVCGCSVLQPFTVTRARLGNGDRVVTLQ